LVSGLAVARLACRKGALVTEAAESTPGPFTICAAFGAHDSDPRDGDGQRDKDTF
jgi:hypothetical protein